MFSLVIGTCVIGTLFTSNYGLSEAMSNTNNTVEETEGRRCHNITSG